VGNVTKAATKGYAVGGSALACFVLFHAFLDEVASFSGNVVGPIDISKVEVMVGGLFGIMMIFLFTGWCVEFVCPWGVWGVGSCMRSVRSWFVHEECVELVRP